MPHNYGVNWNGKPVNGTVYETNGSHVDKHLTATASTSFPSVGTVFGVKFKPTINKRTGEARTVFTIDGIKYEIEAMIHMKKSKKESGFLRKYLVNYQNLNQSPNRLY